MSSDSVAQRLSSHIDELARALARAGAPQAESSRLLELAALATMHAVALTEVAADVDPLPAVPAREAPRPVELRAAA